MTDTDSKGAAEDSARVPAPAGTAGAGTDGPSDAASAVPGGRTGGPGKENAGDNAGDNAGENAAVEIGGRGGADPTRYGDWEINGRCVDF